MRKDLRLQVASCDKWRLFMSNTASDVRESSEPLVVEPMSANSAGFLRQAWEHWKLVAHAVGVVQTRILMVIFYFILVMPLGLMMRLRGDPLHLKPRNVGNWTPHSQQERSLDATRRQF